MASNVIARFLQGNAKFAASYTAPPPLMKMKETWIANGIKGAVILSCSDPRVIPERFMGLESGPVAVIRNAGGRAMDAMRSIQVLNAINHLGLIVVVHHTDCGTTHVKDSEVKAVIKRAGATVPASEVDAMKFGEINDLEASIQEDVAMIRNHPLFAGKAPAVVGMLYEVETGKLREVIPVDKPAF